ncbi:MAG: PSD1 and planctomycete cytochrome C domain-containing protein [Verrucomicrobiota bacterium]
MTRLPSQNVGSPTSRRGSVSLLQWTARVLPLALVGVGATSFAAETEEISSEHLQFFENKIRPIFANSCLECHSAEKGKVKAGFNMDTRADILKGGENGSVLKPGDVKGSAFIKAVEWAEDLQMPPKKKLSDDEIAALKEWVEMGAPDPRTGSTGEKISKKDHWAFQPVKRPTPPTVHAAGWCKTSIDKFILAKLEEKEMLPADPPDTGSSDEQRRKKEALLRRAYFDLIGMPPNPQQVRDFGNDTSPNAFEKVVDGLLASPAYGERWARHWMDTARYSDTTGEITELRSNDYRYAYAYAYRDWVINAINKDMPYDQFVLNQLAADKLPNNDKANLAALGFLTVGQRFEDKSDIINDRIDVVGRGFLGLTLACARCHDHKFDPVKMTDYYALKGVFLSTAEPHEGPVIAGDPNTREYQEFEQKLAVLQKHAYSTVYQMQREFAETFRQAPAAFFEAAYYSKDTTDPAALKKANEIVVKNKLEPGIGGLLNSTVVRRFSPRDPVFGPFVSILAAPDSKEQALQRMIEANANPNAKGPKYNTVVLDFLSKAGKLPGDVASMAALFEKMIREKVNPIVGAPPTKGADPVKDLEKGGIFLKIANPQLDVANSPEKGLMELAVFPKRLIAGADMTEDRVKDTIREWGVLGGGPQLERRSGIISTINELKLTSRGGPVRAMVLEDLPQPVESPVFPRGNVPKKGEEGAPVPRHFLEVLSEDGSPEPFSEGSGRYELAKAIASKSNPLTARVMVNRIWMYHFGEGLVKTPDDLGNQSGTPSHPELLDFLTSWFTDDYGQGKPGWSVKGLHKAIMMSNVYQQSSRSIHMAKQQEMDAGNRLLWRANVRRLDFEAFRDSMLTMGNIIDRTMFGPPVNLVSEPYSYRRSVYGYVDRSNVPDLLMQFDMATPLEPNTKRTSTIVPQQALFLLNSPFAVSIAQQVARRPEVVHAVVEQKDSRAGIIAIFQIVLQRTPSREEFEMAAEFLKAEAKIQASVAAATASTTMSAMKDAQTKLKRATDSTDSRKEIVNVGSLVQRATLTPWETLVQALMFCNEAAYLN